MQHAGTAGRPARLIARQRHTGRRILLSITTAAILGLAADLAYVGVEGSSRFVAAYASTTCTRPSDLPYGWTYEAVNYDSTLDAGSACAPVGARAGGEVLAADGTPIAGWYIPAAARSGDTATVVVVHGHDANKSHMLPIAAALHDRFDLLLVDLRATGYSGGSQQTMGVLEQQDVRAMVDWLVETKAPPRIAALGVSGGAAATLAAMRTDERIGAFIGDSMHARIGTLLAQQVDNAELWGISQPAYPGVWAAQVAIWLRTGGLDLASVDPIDSLAWLGDRELLLIHGTADAEDVPAESVDANFEEARRLGIDVTRRDCTGGAHAGLATACATEYGTWVSEFLDSAFAD